ncbi:MAG: DUF6046 domain-containing protein [Bacteroidales bacterium]|nr:DUF6046 domain-containing protein [Bacteroidales bacterium]
MEEIINTTEPFEPTDPMDPTNPPDPPDPSTDDDDEEEETEKPKPIEVKIIENKKEPVHIKWNGVAWNETWDPFHDLQVCENYSDFAKLLTNISNVVVFKIWSKVINWGFVAIDPKIDVTLKNTIVQTPLTGRRHTVKEYICGNDYEVIITGNLMSILKNTPPLETLLLLRKCAEAQEPIFVASAYLITFNISKLLLKDFKVQQNIKDLPLNTPQYTLTFLSCIDEPVLDSVPI